MTLQYESRNRHYFLLREISLWINHRRPSFLSLWTSHTKAYISKVFVIMQGPNLACEGNAIHELAHYSYLIISDAVGATEIILSSAPLIV